MDFSYDDEQNALREAVGGLLQRAYPASGEQRRQVTGTDPGFDEKTWARLAEMGVLGLPFAEDDGGMGAGPVEVALELTALRVVANSADGRPHPASSVLKLRGSELQQAATELLVDIAGPLSLASFADGGSDVPEWARVTTPEYLNYRKVSIYGGSNEVQRTIIAGTILGL